MLLSQERVASPYETSSCRPHDPPLGSPRTEQYSTLGLAVSLGRAFPTHATPTWNSPVLDTTRYDLLRGDLVPRSTASRCHPPSAGVFGPRRTSWCQAPRLSSTLASELNLHPGTTLLVLPTAKYEYSTPRRAVMPCSRTRTRAKPAGAAPPLEIKHPHPFMALVAISVRGSPRSGGSPAGRGRALGVCRLRYSAGRACARDRAGKRLGMWTLLRDVPRR